MDRFCPAAVITSVLLPVLFLASQSAWILYFPNTSFPLILKNGQLESAPTTTTTTTTTVSPVLPEIEAKINKNLIIAFEIDPQNPPDHEHKVNLLENDVKLEENLKNVPQKLNLPSEDNPESNEPKLTFIKHMTLEAWNNFVSSNLNKNSESNETKEKEWTIVSALSTLWMMDLKEEFNFGKVWIKNFDFSLIDRKVEVGEVVSTYIGGLLSCFALTGEEMFLIKAKEIAQIIEKAYQTPTGLSYQNINPKTQSATGSQLSLSSIANQQLEYTYLSDLLKPTNHWTVTEHSKSITKLFDETEKSNGLYRSHLNVKTGEWLGARTGLFESTNVFYFNLVKSYLQKSESKSMSLQMYSEAVDAIERNGLISISRQNGLYFARDMSLKTHQHGDWMSVEGCYLGGMFALGAHALQLDLDSNIDSNELRKSMHRINRHWQLAEELTRTCHEASVKTRTRLPPQIFYFNDQNNATNGDLEEKSFNFSPELAETYFILWRLTRDPIYREYSWELAQQIDKHCRSSASRDSGIYSKIQNVDSIPTIKLENQENSQAVLLGVTLKFLYLTFVEDSVLPLDQWIFNSFGQPLPVM